MTGPSEFRPTIGDGSVCLGVVGKDGSAPPLRFRLIFSPPVGGGKNEIFPRRLTDWLLSTTIRLSGFFSIHFDPFSPNLWTAGIPYGFTKDLKIHIFLISRVRIVRNIARGWESIRAPNRALKDNLRADDDARAGDRAQWHNTAVLVANIDLPK